jgi:hypothetical protein
MWRTDSGRLGSITSNSSSGAAPPSMSTLRQPQSGIIHAARKPPSAAPSGKPQNMALVSTRRAAGLYSLVSVTALGMAAPSPRPVRKRRMVSSCRLPAKAEPMHAAPMTSTDSSRILRRP